MMNNVASYLTLASFFLMGLGYKLIGITLYDLKTEILVLLVKLNKILNAPDY